MQEFQLPKVLSIKVHPPNALHIYHQGGLLVPPTAYWIKCNTDGTALSCPKLTAYSSIFRDSSEATLGCFARNFGVTYAF
jgi:hypothetical protein